MKQVMVGVLCALAIAGCDEGGSMPTADGGPSPGTDGGPSSGTDGGPSPGTDAAVDPATDTRLFVPDIPVTYAGTFPDPGVALTAWTIRQDPVLRDYAFLLAVRNTFGSPLCALTVDLTFHDATGVRIADAGELVEGPMHRGSSGRGSLAAGCLSDGQTGMFSAPMRFGAGRDPSEIASATFVTGAVNLTDAVPTSDVRITGVMAVAGSFRGQRFTGRIENGTTDTLQNPSVSIFGLSGVGRPLFESGDIDLVTIPPGGSWTFSTSPDFEESYVDVAAFARVREL